MNKILSPNYVHESPYVKYHRKAAEKNITNHERLRNPNLVDDKSKASIMEWLKNDDDD